MWRRASRNSGAIGVAFLLIASLGIFSCDDDTLDPGDDAGISDLSVQVIEGHISANLQPIVPPDPILCQLTLRLVNGNTTNSLAGLSIPSAAVFLSSNSTELGIIRFETDWDGAIGAGEVDTVTVIKIQEDQEIFVPPCNESVYLRARVVKTAVQFKQIKTPSYPFGCPVSAARDE